jgi:type I restriction enzyme S subunit
VSWSMVKLGDLFKISSGGTPSRQKSEYYENGNIHWIKTGDLHNKFINSASEFITAAALANSSTKLYPPKTVLLAMYGATIGACSILEIEACTNQACAAFVPSTNVEPLYLYYCLKNNKANFVRAGAGGAQPNISGAFLKQFEIPLPPLPIQKKIAAALEKADTLRKQCKQMEQELNTLAQSVFLDMFGNVNQFTTLGEHAALVTSGSRGWAKYYAEEGARFIRSLDVQFNHIGARDVAYVDAPADKEAVRAKVQHGDVLITITGSRIGRVCWVTKDIGEAYISQHVALLRIGNDFLPEFVSYFLSLPALGQRQIQKAQYGQTKPGLNLAQIKAFTIPKVTIEEQREFLQIINSTNEIKQENMTNSNHLENLFNALMQRAFKGELDLKDVA